METESRNLLIEGSRVFGVRLDEKALEAFDLFLRELLKWNRKINLTSIRSEGEIVLKHFLDSLSACPYILASSSLLDIGSGAGFPGIPLKMVQPSLEVTLIDSVRKKVDFQRHLIRTLGLQGIETIHGRVQDKQILQSLGGRFDTVISRAFSDLRTLLPLSYPFLKKGGIVLAMKGETESEEVPTISKRKEIRYRWKKSIPFSLPFSSYKRSILLFEKE